MSPRVRQDQTDHIAAKPDYPIRREQQLTEYRAEQRALTGSSLSAVSHDAPEPERRTNGQHDQLERNDLAPSLEESEAIRVAVAEAADSSIVRLAVGLDILTAQTLEQGDTLSDAACAAIVMHESSADSGTKLGIRYSPLVGWLAWQGERTGWLRVPGDATKRKAALLNYVNSVLTAQASALLQAAKGRRTPLVVASDRS